MGTLRLLFALSVIAAHTGGIGGFTLVGGKIAVQSFFIFSGFYIALILDKKYIGKNKSFILFFTNRILRIFPSYWVVLLLSIIIQALFFSAGKNSTATYYLNYHVFQNPLLFLYLTFSQLFILGTDAVMFLGIHIPQGSLYFTKDYLHTSPLLYNFLFIPQAWTLSIELVFYAIAPFLIKKKTGILILIALLSIALRGWIYSKGLHQEPWTNRFLPTELVFFIVGIFSYRCLPFIEKLKSKKYFLLSFYILLVAYTILYPLLKIKQLWFDPSQFLYFALLFISIPFIFSLTRKNKFDRLLGTLSYPVYISHILVFGIIVYSPFNSSKLSGIMTAIGSIIFSYVLISALEKPIDRFRQSRLE